MNEIFSLEGKKALVTGGGTGIGLAITRDLVAAGAKVVISGRREEILKEACAELGDAVSYVVNDIADLKGIPAFVEAVEADGPIDILVNNAGRHIKKSVLDTTDEDFLGVIETNLLGVFALSREVGRCMIPRGEGRIINIVSMTSIFGIPLVCAYTAGKSGTQGLTRQIATEFSPHGITVNAVAPGFIDTAMSRKAFAGDPARKAKVLSRTPMDKLGLPEDVAHAVTFLASPAASYITGVVLPVDGGTSIGF